jgi:hypothetical protein
MNKIALALASTAIAAAASSTLITSAEAGGRGGHGGHRFHFRFHSFPSYTPTYRDEDTYVRRKPKVVVKYITKSAPKQTAAKATPAASAKTEDSQGRMFDGVTKTWFDGKGQCWKGDKAFAYRSGSWFYGNARWVETSSGWGVSTGALPSQVSCDGIQAFSGRIQQAQPNTTVAPAQPKTAQTQAPVEPPVAQVATAPATTTAPEPQANTTPPAAPANARECKKYFPSVGEMVTVPCTE